MVARYAGATLGLLAFAIAVAAGLFTQNPVTVILSRSILALLIFCVIGLVLGGAVELVVSEHEKKRELEIRERYQQERADPDDGGSENASTAGEGGPIGT